MMISILQVILPLKFLIFCFLRSLPRIRVPRIFPGRIALISRLSFPILVPPAVLTLMPYHLLYLFLAATIIGILEQPFSFRFNSMAQRRFQVTLGKQLIALENQMA